MTANVTVVAAESDNVLAVPNAALRFQSTGRKASTVWKANGATLTPVSVQTGLTDGVRTEIVSGDLKEGDTVAVPLATAAQAKSGVPARSPFTGGGGRGR
jgi:HlyD family secretion protein